MILTNPSFDYLKVRNQLIKENISFQLYQLDKDQSLGECLNFGVEKANGEVVAKFDDDDYYGPSYLKEASDVLKNTNAGVVGKSSFYVYFKNWNKLYLYNPKNENKWIFNHNTEEQFKTKHFLSGGSLVIRKEVFDKVIFPHLNVGEDSTFQKDCFNKKIKLYTTSRNHYTHIRYPYHDHHSSDVKDFQLIRRSKLITIIEDFERIVDTKE